MGPWESSVLFSQSSCTFKTIQKLSFNLKIPIKMPPTMIISRLLPRRWFSSRGASPVLEGLMPSLSSLT